MLSKETLQVANLGLVNRDGRPHGVAPEAPHCSSFNTISQISAHYALARRGDLAVRARALLLQHSDAAVVVDVPQPQLLVGTGTEGCWEALRVRLEGFFDVHENRLEEKLGEGL
jgi:hypothetical protein